MARKNRDTNIEFLFETILALQNKEECELFFEDLCTVAELQEMSRRLLAARMLAANTVYTEIAEQTGLSTATISRVNRCLKYGDGGYRLALDKTKKADGDGK